MQIKVRVIPKAKKALIKEEVDGLKVYLTVVPEKGKANKALIKLLADYYKVPKSAISLVKGETSRDKIIEINKKIIKL